MQTTNNDDCAECIQSVKLSDVVRRLGDHDSAIQNSVQDRANLHITEATILNKLSTLESTLITLAKDFKDYIFVIPKEDAKDDDKWRKRFIWGAIFAPFLFTILGVIIDKIP